MSRWPVEYWGRRGRATTTGSAGHHRPEPRRTHCCSNTSPRSTNNPGKPTAGLACTPALGLGLAVNHKRVAGLLRKAGLQGLSRRHARRDPTGPATEDDLAHRQFTVDAPDRLWLTDITKHPTNEGKLHCTAVMDAYSRRIIGWSIAAPMRTELVLDALGMAILQRRPADGDTIMHSDHGTQYTSWAFGQRLRDAGLLPPMGTIGDRYDNSMMESFWATLQPEVLDSRIWETRAELANTIFEWIECWYNTEHRHSSIGILRPVEYEAHYHHQTSTQDDH
ncbi:MAG: IS3 family transposase [Actinomycetes bacterium]